MEKESLLQRLKAHLDSMSEEEKERFAESITHTKFNNRWVERIHSLSTEKRIKLIGKCKVKYDSKEYREREWKLGYEPRRYLFFMLVEYAERYGKNIYEERAAKGDILMFCNGTLWLVDDTYIVELLIGQGSAVNVFTIDEYEEHQKYLKDVYEKENLW